MKIVIIEPLGITPEKLEEATAAVKARGQNAKPARKLLI